MTLFKTLIAYAVSFLVTAISFAANDTSQVHVLSYSGTNVTTSAYVTLVASTPISVSHVEICDTSTKLLKIASGSVGNEKDLFTVHISGCVTMPYYIVAGTRLSIKAVDATASTGYNTLAFLNN